eukprot:CAMPEP_0115853386 /NCGR_PEP_ID=MMETSP0287-20121206/13477_1 /TAXON_ID=412157 /ORGANISM="Chrysochromulina rotalis, Strain UIO044" /LENGTH=210 /DNA_ID=CAMNT_0003307461 /DNA_START=155 /DNA_END=787 /DNA_ORIENTATION=-
MADLQSLVTTQGLTRAKSTSAENDMLAILEETEDKPSEGVVAKVFDQLTDITWIRTEVERGDDAMKMVGVGYMARTLALKAPARLVYTRKGFTIRSKVSMGSFMDLPETEYVVGGQNGGVVKALGKIRVCRFAVKKGEVVAEAKIYDSERDQKLGNVSYVTLGRWRVNEDGSEMVYEELSKLVDYEGKENHADTSGPTAIISRAHFRRAK